MRKIIIANLVLILISSTACKKLVEVDSPNDRTVTSNVFTNDDVAISSLTSIYARMYQEGSISYNIPLLTGLYGDELKNYSTTNSLVAAYTNSLLPENEILPNIWKLGYGHIYHANAVFEGCELSSTLNTAIKKQLMAESRFIRAFWYFYLTNLYGDVPLIITTDYTKSALAGNSTQDEIYKQIIEDLLYAESNLYENYVSGNTRNTTTDRVRPSKYVAKALLARVYLYTKNYIGAETKATEVIGESIYDMESIENAFIKNNKEAIWQIMIPSLAGSASAFTLEGTNFILSSKPTSGAVRSSTLSDQLLNSFEPGDHRKDGWVGEFKDVSVIPNISYFFPNKYKRKVTTSPEEYTTPLRLSEQYLIRAEARANLDKLAASLTDVDVIRLRASLPLLKDTNPNIGKEELLNAILKERRVELFAEWGHRWFDLKRTGAANNVMTNIATSKGASWSSYKLLWPIPVYNIQNNPNIKQNPEYN